MPLKKYLEQLTTQSSGNGRYAKGLNSLLKLARIKASSPRKADMIEALNSYLASPDNIKKIWKELSSFEKEVVEDYVRYKGYLHNEAMAEAAQKYGIQVERKSWGIYHEYLSPESRVNLLILNNQVPPIIANILAECFKNQGKEHLQAIDLQHDLEEEELACYSVYENTEGLKQDFLEIIKLVNTSKLRVTKSNLLPTKSTLQKMNDVIQNKEYEVGDYQLGEIRNAYGAFRTHALYQIFLEAEVLKIEGINIVLGSRVDEFLAKSESEQILMLLDNFMNSEDIKELDSITEQKLRVSYKGSLELARETVLKKLCLAPLNEWIDVEELVEEIKYYKKDFLWKQLQEVAYYADYERCYYPSSGNWQGLERRFIDVILLKYLGALGLVDVVVAEEYEGYDYVDVVTAYLTAKYVRLTPLGAYIFGLTDTYVEEKVDHNSELWVTPELEIIIPKSSKSHSHTLFFERFCEKLERQDQVIFKLDFKMMIRLLDQKIDPLSVIQYVEQESTQSVPENFYLAFEQWLKDKEKIKIRTITIVETEDMALIEELQGYRSLQKYIKNTIKEALVIDSKDIKKVKKEIEQKNYFCHVEE